MATTDREELRQQAEDIRQGKLSAREVYHRLHEFGRENFREARPLVESFLTNSNPELRSIALEVLTRHWRLMEHMKTAQYFLEHDPDKECRMKGASALEILKRNTQDRSTLSLLAHVVLNEQETRSVREAAYAAMRSIIHYDPREQFHLAAKGITSAQEIDWKMVNSYRQAGSKDDTHL